MLLRSGYFICYLSATIPSCQMLGFNNQDPQDEIKFNDSEPIKDSEKIDNTLKRMELNQAQLWTQLEQMELEVKQQKEKIKVLERGLLLGLVPEELKAELDQQIQTNTKEKSTKKPKEGIKTAAKTPDKVMMTNVPQAEVTEETVNDYKTQLEEAKSYLQDGYYGRAILELAKLAKNFPANVTEYIPHYWIGVTWNKLKEFQKASESLAQFIDLAPQNALIPRAHYEKAKASLGLGLKDTGVKELQKLIALYPHEDAAELAREELNRIAGSL